MARKPMDTFLELFERLLAEAIEKKLSDPVSRALRPSCDFTGPVFVRPSELALEGHPVLLTGAHLPADSPTAAIVGARWHRARYLLLHPADAHEFEEVIARHGGL